MAEAHLPVLVGVESAWGEEADLLAAVCPHIRHSADSIVCSNFVDSKLLPRRERVQHERSNFRDVTRM